MKIIMIIKKHDDMIKALEITFDTVGTIITSLITTEVVLNVDTSFAVYVFLQCMKLITCNNRKNIWQLQRAASCLIYNFEIKDRVNFSEITLF